MADVYEQNLAQKSTLTTSDFIRVVGSDNVSYKQLVSSVMATMGLTHDDLGSFANENDLATALNTKLNAVFAGSSAYIRIAITANFGAFTNGATYIGELRKSSANYASISLYGLGISLEIIGYKSPSGWGFQKQPTRAEVDALNSKTEYASYNLSTVLTGSDITGKVIKFGSQITIYAQLGSLSLSAGANTLGTLSKYYPSATEMTAVGFVGTGTVTGTPVRVTIWTNGGITCYAPSALTGTLRFSTSYATSNNS